MAHRGDEGGHRFGGGEECRITADGPREGIDRRSAIGQPGAMPRRRFGRKFPVPHRQPGEAQAIPAIGGFLVRLQPAVQRHQRVVKPASAGTEFGKSQLAQSFPDQRDAAALAFLLQRPDCVRAREGGRGIPEGGQGLLLRGRLCQCGRKRRERSEHTGEQRAEKGRHAKAWGEGAEVTGRAGRHRSSLWLDTTGRNVRR